MGKVRKRRKSSSKQEDQIPNVADSGEGVFSLDSLLEVRENEKKKNQYDFSDGNNSDVMEADIPKMPDQTLERDGSIFSFCDFSYPMRVFDIINRDQSYDIHCIPELTQPQWMMMLNCLDFVEPSQTLLFSLFQELIRKRQQYIGDIILKYASNFPQNSINYTIWFDFLKEAAISCEQLSVYLLALAKPHIFMENSDYHSNSRNAELAILFIASLITPQTMFCKPFLEILSNFTTFMQITDFSQDEIDFIVNSTVELLHDQPIASISYLISYFPFTQNTCVILGQISTILALQYLGFSENFDLHFLCSNIGKIKSLCDSFSNDEIIQASAVLALAERAISCGIVKKSIFQEDLQIFIEGLQFNISNPNFHETLMIRIREQLHITRTQAELILTNHFKVTPK